MRAEVRLGSPLGWPGRSSARREEASRAGWASFSSMLECVSDKMSDWATSEVWVNIVDLNMVANHEEIGQIRVRLNPDIVSSGQIFPTLGPGEPKACRIATGVTFEIDQLEITVYNREPILLMNDHVTQIPPVDDPSGRALLFLLPLYDRADPNPDAEPVAYLTSLRYGADNYLTEEEVRSFQER
jgi:hypothetical protein